MIALIQRVHNATVNIDCKKHSSINSGLLILLGIHNNDTNQDIEYLCKKIIQLRIFNDQDQKMNLSIKDVSGEILVISQFTLYANCVKGNRPSFIESATHEVAKPIYINFLKRLKSFNINIQSGIFGKAMYVSLINHGPVTIILNSKNV